MSGPYIKRDGTVISSALAIDKKRTGASNDLRNNFSIEQGQIVRIRPVDDSKSGLAPNEGNATLYDVKIIKANGAQETIRFCRMLQPGFGGGINNFLEVLPTDNGLNDDSKDGNLKRGHFVLVGFISGVKNSGVILGALPHSARPAVARRPKKAQGVHTEGEIQGLNFKVSDDGSLNIIFNGPRNDNGSLINTSLGPTSIEITKEGNVKVATNKKQSVLIDRVTKKIHVTNGPTYIDMDQDADRIQVVAKIVETGTGGLQPQVVGNDWKKIMERLIEAIENIVVPTGVGPSGNPINKLEFEGIKNDLKEALSRNHTVEK